MLIVILFHCGALFYWKASFVGQLSSQLIIQTIVWARGGESKQKRNLIHHHALDIHWSQNKLVRRFWVLELPVCKQWTLFQKGSKASFWLYLHNIRMCTYWKSEEKPAIFALPMNIYGFFSRPKLCNTEVFMFYYALEKWQYFWTGDIGIHHEETE